MTQNPVPMRQEGNAGSALSESPAFEGGGATRSAVFKAERVLVEGGGDYAGGICKRDGDEWFVADTECEEQGIKGQCHLPAGVRAIRLLQSSFIPKRG